VNLAISAKLLWMVSRPGAMTATEHFFQASLESFESVRAQSSLHFVNVESLMSVTVHRNGSETKSVGKRVRRSKYSRWYYTSRRDGEEWRH
jgi:hypothetical protein